MSLDQQFANQMLVAQIRPYLLDPLESDLLILETKSSKAGLLGSDATEIDTSY